METKLYINDNGKVLEYSKRIISSHSRAFLYGDGLFESIRVIDGRVINLENHISRLLDGMIALKINIPNHYNTSFFEKKIKELISKSNINEGGKIRLSIDREYGEGYSPVSNDPRYLIEIAPYHDNAFHLNHNGWKIDLYTTLKKDINLLSNFKTKNALLNVMASIEATEKKMDDLLLTNTSAGIIEGTSSNLFVVGNGILYTPGLEEGCVGGTMRMTIINIALKNNIRVYESPIRPQNLLIADEVFLTNAIKGIIWVEEYKSKQYKNEMANRLNHLLNEHFKN